MHDLSSWSIRLGHFVGVTVRVHAFFLIFAVFTLFLGARERMVTEATMALVVLFLSVLWHEMGHAFAAFRLGGRVEDIVLGPLGGLAFLRTPAHPRHDCVIAAAGPVANLLVVVALLPLLMKWGIDPVGLLHPMIPDDLVSESGTGILVVTLAFWLNWVLALVNLIPAFPLDGGRFARSLLWPYCGYRNSVIYVATAAKITAVGLCIAAWFARDAFPGEVIPAWFSLTLLAIFLFFSAKHEMDSLLSLHRPELVSPEEASLEYGGEDLFTSTMTSRSTAKPARRPSIWTQWLARRRESKLRRLKKQEMEEERRVDEILSRVHADGMEHLSPADKKLLRKVSARYRERLNPSSGS